MAKETISQTEGLCKEVATCIRIAYEKGYKQGQKDMEQNTMAVLENGKMIGREEAWECARKMGLKLTKDTVNKIFNGYDYFTAIKYLSASEAIQKIKEYEEKQKADSEVKVGDEVTVDERHFVVIGIENGEWRHLWCTDNGLTYSNICTHDMKKTGRHFDQIAEVLEQLKGE